MVAPYFFGTYMVKKKITPLAHLMRPQSLQDITGQDHLLNENGVLARLINKQNISSMIFWGPPGSGKTSMVRIIAQKLDLNFIEISAIFSGVTELKKIFSQASINRKPTLLFIDEIHRFNKAQQDSLLPVIEDGTIICIGATTENPSFELNAALLSRMQVIVFNRHNYDSLNSILLKTEQQLAINLPIDESGKNLLINMADGDARILIAMIETLIQSANLNEIFNLQQLQNILQKRAPIYDKGSDGHYNLISALHKSIRGSDADATLYYFSRMIEAGENALYIARRLVRMAIEDIGLADPKALLIANAAKDAYHFLGSPDGELALANACVYLATAPKSAAVYKAYNIARTDAKKYGSLTPPKHILNAPTKFMKEQGYGADYIYDANEKYSFSGQEYFPEEMGHKYYYHPVDWGFEKEVKKRLEWWAKLKKNINNTHKD